MVEELAARWVIALSMFLIAAFSLIAVLPTPAGLPEYARFLPVDLSLPEQASSNESESTPVPNPPNSATATAANVPDVPNVTVATATVTVESANCRARPRGGAERLIILYRSQVVEIVGRNEDLTNPWWYVKIPETDGNCWLWGMTASMTGNIEEIPIVK